MKAEPALALKPTLGRIVRYHFPENHIDIGKNNGSLVCPAIICAVHSDVIVNLHLMADSNASLWKPNVSHGEAGHQFTGWWEWPEKV